MPEPFEPSRTLEPDPVYSHSRREALMIMVLWAVSSLYAGAYCYLFGYRSHEPSQLATGTDVAELAGPLESLNRSAETLAMPFGIPDWVFWGVVVPWVICIVLTFVYCLFIYVEDDLGEESEAESVES